MTLFVILETPVPYKSDAPNENISIIFLRYLNFSKSQAVGGVIINNCNRYEVMPKNAQTTAQLHSSPHASKVMLKILQARIQQYVNRELPDVQYLCGFISGFTIFFYLSICLSLYTFYTF